MLITITSFIIVSTALGILVHFNVQTFLRPKRRHPKRTPSDLGITQWEDVNVATEDAMSLKAWFIPPRLEQNGAVILFLHGLGGNRSDLLRQAHCVTQRGYGAMLIDFRNHGESEGKLTSLGNHEVRDVLAAFAYLNRRDDVNNERIGMVGHSMGAATGIQAAEHMPALKFMVVQSSFSSLRSVFRQALKIKTSVFSSVFAPILMQFYKLYVGSSVDKVNPAASLARLGCPVMIVHGLKDQFIPPSHSDTLFQNAPHPQKRLHLVNNARHRSILGSKFTKIEPDFQDFIEEHFRLGGERGHQLVSQSASQQVS